MVWGVWHLPAFYLGGTVQSDWAFLPFLIASVALSVILTALFNDARGSLLWPALLHFQVNNPLWPDAQHWDMPAFVGAVLAVVWLRRERMLSRKGAATEVMTSGPATGLVRAACRIIPAARPSAFPRATRAPRLRRSGLPSGPARR